MMSGSDVRVGLQPVSSGLRAYFSPVRREDERITSLDPATLGNFDLELPPVPWVDAGWVDGLHRKSETKFGAARRGKRATAAAQYRTQLDARIEIEFREWGKVQMALSAGSEHFNILAAGIGGATQTGVPVLEGSTSTKLLMTVDDLARFTVGDLVAVDIDYQQQSGFVGTGIAGSWFGSTDLRPSDPDYVRRVTFNIGRVAAKTADALVLDGALAGGDPLSGAAAQKVVGFTDREGGKFLQEWSALFVLPEITGGRIFLYYPRLQPACGGAESGMELASGLQLNSLKASFIAMPCSDPLDGEAVLCYRSYIPANAATLV